MFNFDFYNPTRIVFGKNRLNELVSFVPKDKNVLVLYGGGSVKKYGTLQKVTDVLSGYKVFEFGGIEPNPRFETLMKAVEIVKKENIGFLLAVGGGSVMDGTKFIALASKYQGNKPDEILYQGYKSAGISEALPFGTVVTLPATGSEMNSGGVISYGNGKYVVFSPLTFPQFSFLDPSLTFTLPPAQVANGVVDTYVHVLEQYLTYPVEARFQDRTAEGILQTLIEIGRKTIDNPADYDLRANLVWNATMALNGLIGSGVPSDWTTHMIGHELTAFFGVDHAVSLAIITPSLLNIRKDKKREKLIQYAERVWKIDEKDDDKKIELAINKTREFFESLGIKTRLSDYGIKEPDFDKVIKGLETKGMTKLSEHKDVTLEISRKILENAL
ncbi:MAG: NADH-dependent alcohol dehydrogenase [Ignavibacteriae bacterium HGW-Ignavibacteriae-3]|nr:MAG: NADH-dependent alcohol dehydrogenase [Ignavibacteriae bacterium HGW-Ignavibacteriae-3]